MTSLYLYWQHIGFYGADKPSSLVTTLLNHTFCFEMVCWRENEAPERQPGRVSLGAGDRLRLSRDFTDGYYTWGFGSRTYDVLVRFFPCRVYINSSHHDTLGYEWLLVRCCHLIVRSVVLWIRGWLLWLYCQRFFTVFTLHLTLTYVNVLLVYVCYCL
jgi:hypothetical protein